MKSKRFTRRRYIVGYNGERNRKVLRDRLSALRYARKIASIDGFDTMFYDCNIKRYMKVYNECSLHMRGELRQSYLDKRYMKRVRRSIYLSRGERIALFGY